MRIGILIGVSEYKNCTALPGCNNDISAIADVLEISKEFDDIRTFSKKVESSKIKSELSKLFSEWKGNNIEEIFFYFSGHGNFFQNEFYYLLSDFDETQRRQTSLQNSDIDNMMKSISPKMVTKVIDACQSGVSYIKGNTNVIEKYYSKTTESFEKCYFLHSSMTNQYSYQNDELSDFTKSFLESISINKKPSIRYKDIIDYISDQFEKSTEQTPFFITQADHTESFLNSSPELQEVINKYIKKSKIESEATKEEIVIYDSYIDKIKKDAELYSNQEEVEKLLQKIKDLIEKTVLKTELKEVYNLKSNFEPNLRLLPKVILIGKWLEDNPNDFFAKPEYERVSYQEEDVNYNVLTFSISNMLRGNKMVTKYKNELIGFEQFLDLPFNYVLIEFAPLYPNLIQYAYILTFVISKKDIKFFNAFTSYKDKDWTRKSINENFKWQSSDFLIKNEDKIINHIRENLDETENNLLKIIKQKFESEK